MIKEQLHLEEITELLKHKRSSCSGVLVAFQPFELKAVDLLAFARQDLTGGSERELANALGNVHRAINCRVDELLSSMMLSCYSIRERWCYDYRKKVEVLQQLGVPIRSVLKKLIRDIRNRLEHQYERPRSREEVQDAFEVGSYFLEATDRYLDGTWGAISDLYIEGGEWPMSRREPTRADFANEDDYYDAHDDYMLDLTQPGPELYEVSFHFHKDIVRLLHRSLVTKQARYRELQLPQDCSIQILMEFMSVVREVMSPVSIEEVFDPKSELNDIFGIDEEIPEVRLDDDRG